MKILKSLSILIIINITFILSKIFDDYASFDTCQPYKKCRYTTISDKIKSFVRGVSNPCSKKNVDDSFLSCLNNFFLCGYIPVYYNNNNTAVIDSQSGIRIGNGLDLANTSEMKLIQMGIPNILIKKLEPLMSLKGEEAYQYLITSNFTLTQSEGEVVEYVMENYPIESIEFKYDRENKLNSTFRKLDLGIKTALASLYVSNNFQFEERLWDLILTNNFDQVYYYIRSNNSEDFRGKLQSSLLYPNLNINNFAASVFLIDISSIDEIKFNNIQTFLIEFIKSHQGNNSINDHQYSFILINNAIHTLTNFDTFNNTLQVLSELKYSNYFDPSLINEADINSGLKESHNLLNLLLSNKTSSNINNYLNIFLITNTFNKTEEETQSILKTSELIRNDGINIISIIVENKNILEKLTKVSGELSNVIYNEEINYFNLNCYNEKIHFYYKFNHILINKNFTNVSIINKSTNYYKIKLNKNKNSLIKFNSRNIEENNNKLQIFASYVDPFPDEFSYDYIHEGNNSNLTQVIIIQGDTTEMIKNSKYYDIRNSIQDDIYITVRSNNSNLIYDLETFECDPNEEDCRPGSNDSNDNANSKNKFLLILIIILSIVFLVLFIVYLIRCYRKAPKENISTRERTSNYHRLGA